MVETITYWKLEKIAENVEISTRRKVASVQNEGFCATKLNV